MRSALIATLISSGFTPAPLARPPVDHLAQLAPVAIQYWGGHLPPCGQPRYTIASLENKGAAAEANPATCVVRFDPAEWPTIRSQPASYLCPLVLHETGHLYGHPHTATGLMAQGSWKFDHWRQLPPCASLAKVRSATRATIRQR